MTDKALMEATIRTYKEAAERYARALMVIRSGTKDTEFPLRHMGADEMQRVAAEALMTGGADKFVLLIDGWGAWHPSGTLAVESISASENLARGSINPTSQAAGWQIIPVKVLAAPSLALSSQHHSQGK
jgi:hypothetical protein